MANNRNRNKNKKEIAKKKKEIKKEVKEEVVEYYKAGRDALREVDKNIARIFVNSLNSREKALDTMIEHQYQKLQEFYGNITEEGKRSIRLEMRSKQEETEKQLREMQKSFELYNHVLTKEEKKRYDGIVKRATAGFRDISAQMKKRFDEMEDITDELAEVMKDSFTSKFSEAAQEIREFAMQLNIDSIAQSLEDSVDNYVETMRDIRRRTGDNFNEKAFQRTVSDIVDSTATMSRAEAANLLKDFIGTSAIKDAKIFRPYLREVANATKALGSSIEDMQDIIYIDMSTMGEKDMGKMVTAIDNVALSLEMNNALNVDAHDLLRSINDNIHGIYGITQGDSKRQMGMVKSLSAIEGIQQTTYNKGIDHMSDQFKEWMTKSKLELMEDENFTSFIQYTGYSYDDFLSAREDPAKMAELLSGYAGAAARMEDSGEVALHSMAQALGMTDAALKEAAQSYKSGEMKEVSKNIMESLKNLPKGKSLAEHQAGKGSGIVEKFWNKASDNFIVRGVSDIFANFDMKLANMANAAIVASKGAELYNANKQFFDSIKSNGFFKTIKGTERYQKSMSDGMLKTIRDSKFYKKFFTGDFAKHITKPIGETFSKTVSKVFKSSTYTSIYNGVVNGFKTVWTKYIGKSFGETLIGRPIKSVLTYLGKHLPNFGDFINFGKAMEGATGRTAEVLGKTMKPVASFTDKIMYFFTKFSGAAKFLKGLPIFSMAIDSIFGLFKTTDWFGEGASIGQYIITGIVSAIAGSGGGLNSDDSIVGSLFDIVTNGFKGAAAGAVFGPHGAIAGAVIGAVTAAIGGERIAKAVDWVKENILSIPDMFVKTVKDAFNSITTSIVEMFEKVKNFISHPIDSIFGKTDEDRKRDKAFKEIDDAVYSGVKGYYGDIKGYANGLSYVPYDNFPALLHEGESVLTKMQASQFRSSNISAIDNIVEYLEEINLNLLDIIKYEKDTTEFAFENFKKTGLFGKKKDSIFDRIKKSLFGGKSEGTTASGGFFSNLGKSFGFGGSSGGSGASVGSVIGNNPAKASTSKNENQRKIWDFFKSKGMSEAGIAGLMGNLYAESNLESNIVEGGSHANEITLDGSTGYGLAQWTSLNRQQGLAALAKAKGTSTSDLNTQLEYLWQELNGSYKGVLSQLMNATSIQEASNAVLHDFESPYDQSVAVENLRASYARKIQQENANFATDVKTVAQTPAPTVVPTSASFVKEDVGAISTPVVNNTPAPDNKDVVDTMKWQVYRLESKLDTLISIMANNGKREIPALANRRTETDMAFSSL